MGAMVAPAANAWTGMVAGTRVAGWRLSRSIAWKMARFVALLVAVVFTTAVVVLGAKGHVAGMQGVVGRACVVVAWLATPLVAWWAAGDRARIDRDEGMEALARIHGVDAHDLARGRVVAATVRLAVLVWCATAPVLVAVAATAPTMQAAWRTVEATAPLAGFAIGAGLTGGGLASLCGVIAPSRGRSLWAAVVLVPWMLDGMMSSTRAEVSSIPGLLGFLADLTRATVAGS
jgi:hypothetical protein